MGVTVGGEHQPSLPCLASYLTWAAAPPGAPGSATPLFQAPGWSSCSAQSKQPAWRSGRWCLVRVRLSLLHVREGQVLEGEVSW